MSYLWGRQEPREMCKQTICTKERCPVGVYVAYLALRARVQLVVGYKV